MATGDRLRAQLLWPVEARLAALLPDLLVFRKPGAPEPELATAQGVLLGVHVTGEGGGRRVAPRPAQGRPLGLSAQDRGVCGPGPGEPRRRLTAGRRPRETRGRLQNHGTPLGMVSLSP